MITEEEARDRQASAGRSGEGRGQEEKKMERLILGYVTDGALESVTKEDALRLTHINLAFGVIREGLLDMSHLPHIREDRKSVV